MIQHVAVVHPGAGSVGIETYGNANGLLERDVDRILPRDRMNRLLVLVERLKEEAVQMKGMRPGRRIDQRPDLHLAGLRLEVRLPAKRRSIDAVLERTVAQLSDREIDGRPRRVRQIDW